MAKYNLEKMSSLLGEVQSEQSSPQFLRIDVLQPFSQHPFKAYSEEKMDEMVASVQMNGIVSPLIVRPAKQSGYYEILSGHNRMEAARRAGLKEVPVIVRELDDENAVIVMVDSNFNQRDQILPSERAFAYKLKHEAIKKMGSASERVSGKRSDEIAAEEMGIKRMTLQRFIRLTELIPALLDKVDKKHIGFIPAVNLSYLSKDEQTLINELMDLTGIKPSRTQTEELRNRSKSGMLDPDGVYEVLDEKETGSLLPISAKQFRSLLPLNLQYTISQEEANDILEEAMSLWCEHYKGE